MDVPRPRFLLCGDRGISVELGDCIDPVINRRVHRLLWPLAREELNPLASCASLIFSKKWVDKDIWACSGDQIQILESKQRPTSARDEKRLTAKRL